MTRRDWITDLGIAVVGAAAAVLTFTTLRDLALAVGIRGWLSWLVPVTVDAAGIVAARVWLRQVGPAEAVRFARAVAWSCIGLSVVGNAGQHYMDAFAVAAPWWVVVAVSAVPPAMLGAVVHLGHLARRTTAGPAMTAAEVEAVEEAAGVPVVADQVTRPCHVYRLHSAEGDLLYIGVGWDVAERLRKHRDRKAWWPEVASVAVTTYPRRVDALAVERAAIAEEGPRHNRLPGGHCDAALVVATGMDLRTRRQGPPADWTPADPIAERGPTPVAEVVPARRTPTALGGPTTESPEQTESPDSPELTGSDPDETLVSDLVEWVRAEGAMPSRERVRLRYGIGSKRADRLRTLAADPLTTEGVRA